MERRFCPYATLSNGRLRRRVKHRMEETQPLAARWYLPDGWSPPRGDAGAMAQAQGADSRRQFFVLTEDLQGSVDGALRLWRCLDCARAYVGELPDGQTWRVSPWPRGQDRAAELARLAEDRVFLPRSTKPL